MTPQHSKFLNDCIFDVKVWRFFVEESCLFRLYVPTLQFSFLLDEIRPRETVGGSQGIEKWFMRKVMRGYK